MSDLAVERGALLDALRQRNYSFITPTPATHARILARSDKNLARDLRDIFGWSLPFTQGLIDADLLALMRRAGALAQHGDGFISRFRVSSLSGDLFLHSAYPTRQQDAVFFGPDSYRFAAFVGAELPRFGPINRLADIGAGSGVGAMAAQRCTEVSHLTLTDINPEALELAQANFLHANAGAETGHSVEFVLCDGLDEVDAPLHAIIANPPYIIDTDRRAYRDGGRMLGAEVSLAWAETAAKKLACGGAFLLYTGSAIVGGEDRLKAAVHDVLRGFDISYREIDPDVFGEELERADYADVERIAVVGVVAVKR